MNPAHGQGEASFGPRDLLQRPLKSCQIGVVASYGYDKIWSIARCCNGSDPRPVPRYDSDPSSLLDEVMHNTPQHACPADDQRRTLGNLHRRSQSRSRQSRQFAMADDHIAQTCVTLHSELSHEPTATGDRLRSRHERLSGAS
ncbi:hypothetical protein ABZ826_13120 [Streptomyces sp. NPDC047515]|uniref:hypothetical protein n=1 Tax=Streptomyces sp. NPDC047515 TaxID=3155380 RepID=UPI0033ECCB93